MNFVNSLRVKLYREEKERGKKEKKLGKNSNAKSCNSYRSG